MTYATTPNASAEDFWINENRRSGWADSGDPNEQSQEQQELYFSLTEKPKHISAVMYMGKVQGQQRTPEEIIEGIDLERRTGNIGWRPSEDSKRLLHLSKYGIKVADVRNVEVYLRVPMQNICSVLHYAEDTQSQTVVIETYSVKESMYTYYVFNFPDEKPSAEAGASAKLFCKVAAQAFDVLHSKAVLEAHTS
eukprot:m.340364 g.340364  ORF g.340364 m.340364 type:complete len:194 (-) comp19256_c0_seq1:79-660(-)